ncbi:hypothetical protein B0H13DRAFT_1949197, partial [Mycena leptocephala]
MCCNILSWVYGFCSCLVFSVAASTLATVVVNRICLRRPSVVSQNQTTLLTAAPVHCLHVKVFVRASCCLEGTFRVTRPFCYPFFGPGSFGRLARTSSPGFRTILAF